MTNVTKKEEGLCGDIHALLFFVLIKNSYTFFLIGAFNYANFYNNFG